MLAEASDESLAGIEDPKARTVASLVSASFLFVAALSEAAVVLNAGLISQATLHGADTALAKLALGAEKLLLEPEMARAFRVMQIVVAAGMREMLAVSAEVLATEHTEGLEWRT